MAEAGAARRPGARRCALVETVFGFIDRDGGVERVRFDVVRGADGAIALARRDADDALPGGGEAS